MEFDDEVVAERYNGGLCPILFLPWARKVAAEEGPWEGLCVLDLACGTGVVTEQLASCVGERGSVVDVDLSASMLAVAEKRCADCACVRFIRASAESMISIPDASVDVVVCQQGFQFFADKAAAAREIRRVLKPRTGRAYVSCWLPIEHSDVFGPLATVAERLGLDDMARAIRAAYDFAGERVLRDAFDAAGGFLQLAVAVESLPLGVIAGDADDATLAAIPYHTPLCKPLRALPDAQRADYDARYLAHVKQKLAEDADTALQIQTLVLRASVC